MKRLFILFAALTSVCVFVMTAQATSIFINEIHYDNTGSDIGEGVEIAGPSGNDLTGWSIVLYNGSNGLTYNTVTLSGVIPNQQDDFGAIFFSITGIQNGAPDGIALVDSGSIVVQFLSYEGTLAAVDGPANGLTSVDIGVSESSGTSVGDSLQLTGFGYIYEDFTWSSSMTGTYDSINTEQIIVSDTEQVVVPEPSTILLLASGLIGLAGFRKKLSNLM